MSGKVYFNEHKSLINLLRANSAELLREAKKQEKELNDWLKKQKR